MSANIMNESINQISFSELSQWSSETFKHLKKKWYLILIALVVGVVGSFFFQQTQKNTFAAKTSFVVEETRNSSGLSSLAGQLGFDISSGASGTLIAGDNLLMFLRSKSLTKEVLLTTYTDNGEVKTLADLYVSKYNLKKIWSKKITVSDNKPIFYGKPSNEISSLTKDSLLQIIVNKIVTDQIKVERPEKKASFINVEVKSLSEQFAFLYTRTLVQKAIERYINARIKRQRINVERLQARSDSLEKLLNLKTFSNAVNQEQIIDLNPAIKTPSVSTEISSREKMVLFSIFSEVSKNLEIAKIQLNQETPTIQVVDDVELPLQKVKPGKLILVLIPLLSMILTCLVILYFKKKSNV